MKKQIKKSLSLFMAVLMLLSCWVWVAPEKAAAAGPEDGQYYVKIEINVNKYSEMVNTNNLKINYKKADGTDTSKTVNPTKSLYQTNKNDVVFFEGYIDGFPTGFDWTIKLDWKAGGTTLRLENARMFVGKDSSSCTTNVITADNYEWSCGSFAFGGGDEATFSRGTNADMYPKITTINNGPAATATVTVPKINTAAEDKKVFTNNFSVKCYDQYGVRITDPTVLSDSISIGLKTDNNAALDLGTFTKEDTGLWYENGNVWYNKDAQELMPGKTGTEYYLFAHFNSSRYGEKNQFLSTIKLNYPTYTVSVDQHGSISGLNASMVMSDGNTQTDTWSTTGIYQAVAPVYPTGIASKDGYVFKGFWTKPQPTTGDAGYNTFEAEFAEPVSTTDFVKYGGAEDGTYVTDENGKTYYNAGTRLTAENNKEILGDATYYGWWNAQDITAKFYDVDGTYLGTKTTKFGKTEGEDWYPDPKDGYVTGAYEYQGFAKKWRDITGAEVPEGTYKFGALSTLSLTPIYENKVYSDKYTVTFIDPLTGLANGGNNQDDGIGSGKYEYRHILSGVNIPTVSVPVTITLDPDRAYEVTGWSTQVPANGKYHVVAKDDASFVENTDWVVRENVTYYPVLRYTIKEYVVSFTYIDTSGVQKTDIKYVPYGSAITTPDNVNRTYAMSGFGYTLEGWDYLNPAYATVMLGVDNAVTFNNETVLLSDSNLKGKDPETPVAFTANYDEGQPTPYTVTFKYKNENGIEKAITTEVYHGSKITADTVKSLAVVPAQYDDGTALYTFADKWIVTEGTAGKTEYTADEFTSFAPESHVTFEAVYGEGVPFYTVKYVDGAKEYSERILAGSNLPVWMVGEGDEAKEYTPVKAKSETGEYKFEGWFDEKQTDESCKETNGTKYTAASTVNSDLVLYPQFKFSPFKFTIKFVGYDGTQLAATEVEAGQSYASVFYEAQRAAQRRPDDKVYSYTFIGWDQPYDENKLVCEGKDVTFTALYRPSYVYYKANWFNSAFVDGKWVATGNALATTSYTYEGAVYAPSVDLDVPTGAPTGESYVFAGWKYLKDGVEYDYVRGMTITAEMSFYAYYTTVKNAVTVTTVVGDVRTEYPVEYGKTATVIGKPLDGYVDATYHNEFVGWYADEAYEIAFDVENTAITAPITIYAKFNTEEHNKDQKELIGAPTYYAKGSEKIWCACSSTTAEIVEIPMLTDKVAPTGTIYLGTQGKWSSTDEVFAKDDTNKYYANADTDLILTINDTAGCADAGEENHTCVDCTYNPAGTGKGIRMIRAFVSSDTFTAEQADEASKLAITVFTDNTENLNNTANYTVKVNSFAAINLEDGEEYIIYYYAVDKANNVLNTNVRTAKFVYDITAPVFTVEGDSNATTAKSTATYCGKATVKGIEANATVTVNGETVTPAAGEYVINEAGNYIIKVTDLAGNTTSKKIIVAAGHNEVTTEQAATCIADGYKLVTCAVCKKELSKETYKSNGHQYSAATTVAPTCEKAGYDIKTCSVCGDEVKTNEKPATDHQHAKDDDGNLIYEDVTPATCSTVGKKISNCTVCGKDTKTETIPVDTTNGHKYGATKVLKATCEANGEEYQTCKYCFEKKTVKSLPKLEHKDTGRYTKVTAVATCKDAGVETTYCKACNAIIGTADIPATGKHIWVASTDSEKTFEATADKDGQITYECQTCDATKVEIISKIEKFTVTFYAEDGTTKLFEIPAVVKGTTISENYTWTVTTGEGEDTVTETKTITEPTKTSDLENNYTFAGWADLNGNAVKFPFELTANTSLKATFTAVKRIYTHFFVNEDGSSFMNIIGTYKSADKKPAAVPTKAADALNTYKFAGWTVAGKLIDDFTMIGDATFVAKFDSEAKTYNVNFYVGNELYENAKVAGGNKVSAPTENPVKAADDNAHYTFAGWYADKSLTTVFNFNAVIADNTRVYAKFTSADHVYKADDEGNTVYESVTDATCTKEGEGIKKCTVCEREAKDILSKAPHSYVEQADGSKICSVCGDKIAAEIKEVVITFVEKIGTTTKELKRYEAAEGKVIEFTAPEKSDTAQYDYEFINWTDADGKVVGTEAKLTVTAGTADATYTANYSATVRKYYVTYFDAEYNILQTTEVSYGADIPAYTGAEPTKAPGTTDHYTFDGWSTDLTAKVMSQLDITPKFDPESHDGHWVDGSSNTPATCTQDGTINKKCSVCGLEIPSAVTSKATGHDYECVDQKAADYGVEGYKKYVCQNDNCPEKEKTDVIPALTYKKLTVTVKDGDKLVYGIGVDIYKDGVRVNAETAFTNNNGVVVFENLEEGKYTVLLEGGKTADVTVKADAEITLNLSENTSSGDNSGSQEAPCSCSCHRDGFWGIIFRFFHTFISWFTGRVNCCSNPDSRY